MFVRLRFSLLALVLTAIVAWGGFLPGARAQQKALHRPAHIKIGEKLPGFFMKGLSGQYRSNAEMDGKVTLLCYWYIGCSSCMKELAYLNLLIDSVSDEGFQILSFARNSEKDLKAFLGSDGGRYRLLKELYKLPAPRFEVLPCCDDDAQKQQGCTYLTDELGLIAYPTTVLVDKTGKVRMLKAGFPGTASIEQPFSDPYTKAYFNLLRSEIQYLLKE